MNDIEISENNMKRLKFLENSHLGTLIDIAIDFESEIKLDSINGKDIFQEIKNIINKKLNKYEIIDSINFENNNIIINDEYIIYKFPLKIKYFIISDLYKDIIKPNIEYFCSRINELLYDKFGYDKFHLSLNVDINNETFRINFNVDIILKEKI